MDNASHRSLSSLGETCFLFRNLPAPGKDLRFGSSCFSLFDITVPIVKKRQTRPANLIVRTKLGCAFVGFDCLGIPTDLHQGHAKSVPVIDKFRIDLNATAIFFHRAFEISNRVVEDFVTRSHAGNRFQLATGDSVPVEDGFHGRVQKLTSSSSFTAQGNASGSSWKHTSYAGHPRERRRLSHWLQRLVRRFHLCSGEKHADSDRALPTGVCLLSISRRPGERS